MKMNKKNQIKYNSKVVLKNKRNKISGKYYNKIKKMNFKMIRNSINQKPVLLQIKLKTQYLIY